MLSRVADALYWMSRYVERAEHGARLLEVMRRLRIDLEEVDPETARRKWEGALHVLGLPSEVDLEGAIFDVEKPGSVACSVFRARENARQVREVVSAEMWDYLNRAHWEIGEARTTKTKREILSATLGSVMETSFLWGGVADATMARGPGWTFIRLGQFVERLDRTSRIIAEQWRGMQAMSEPQGRTFPGEHVEWITLLRSCGSLDEYRRHHPTRLAPKDILDFLILGRTYPRTVRYSLNVTAELARRLSADSGGHGRPTERAFGRLAARVDYAELSEILAAGPADYLDGVIRHLVAATNELQRAYFLH